MIIQFWASHGMLYYFQHYFTYSSYHLAFHFLFVVNLVLALVSALDGFAPLPYKYPLTCHGTFHSFWISYWTLPLVICCNDQGRDQNQGLDYIFSHLDYHLRGLWIHLRETCSNLIKLPLRQSCLLYNLGASQLRK